MRKIRQLALLLFCLTCLCQTTGAQNITVFSETFDSNNGTGGRDDKYDGNIASSDIKFGSEGWTSSYCYGGKVCARIGNSSNNGVLTTPAITPGSRYALLTFSAAGWGDNKNNTLTLSAPAGIELTGDVNITLVNQEWLDYSVLIDTNGAANFTLTFTGKRDFLDDIVVRRLETISTPTLPESGSFWQNTTEPVAKSIPITVPEFTNVRYTTDGSEPTTSLGTLLTASSTIVLTGNTTVKAIAFIGELTSAVSSKTYTLGETKNGIAAFKTLAEDQEARLYLSANMNARVLHLDNKKCYLRDNTGAICLDFNTVAAFNPTPQHDQHVAGWIVGKYQTISSMPTFVATENTTTEHIAFAAPIMETATEPVAISNSDVNNYRNDWVRIENVRVPDSNAGISDVFSTITTTPTYDNALVDVSGIVTADNTVSPVAYNSIKPLVYVIDEDENFTSPASDIAGATVRLKRTLSSSFWNTFAVPFSFTPTGDLAGAYRQYTSAADNTMVFSDADEVMASKPYLVKPTANIENPVFENVTLSALPAEGVGVVGPDFVFAATYSPKELKTDKTERFLRTDGTLGYSNNSSAKIKGMRAYFVVPAGSEARVIIDGEATALSAITAPQRLSGVAYNLQGQRVPADHKGIVIVNGKKFVNQ